VVGATVNHTGAFRCRATRVEADRVLARIIRLVEDAQAGKPPIQRLADRIAAVFLPLVMAAGLLTFLGWLWLGPEPPLSHAFVAAPAIWRRRAIGRARSAPRNAHSPFLCTQPHSACLRG
jgi:Cu+-exporting ATPase